MNPRSHQAHLPKMGHFAPVPRLAIASLMLGRSRQLIPRLAAITDGRLRWQPWAKNGHLRDPLAPQFLAGECGAFGQRLKLRPGDLRMNTAANAPIRAGDDVFAARDLCAAHDGGGEDLRRLEAAG